MTQHVIIIGGGPAGYHSALSCRNAGLDVTLIEQQQIGGTCTHKGCIPTRSYLSAIKARHQLIAANPSLASTLKLDPKELALATQQKIDRLAFGMDYMVRRKKVKLLQGKAAITGDREVTFSYGSKITGDHIIIATGSEPIVPQNHNFRHVYDDSQLLTLTELPKEITVVGGGVLGIELAVILKECGCDVTLAERMPRILPSWDEDIANHIHAYLESLGIKVLTSAEELCGENGVFCIGRTPKLPKIAEDIDMQAPWLHIIGDAAGGTLTADTAIAQGDAIATKITKSDAVDTSKLQAKCLFTPLEAASVGELAGADDIVAYQDLGYTPTGVLFGTDLGFVKVIIDRDSHRLKGFHIVSHMASEIIQMGQLAIAQGMTAEEFCQLTLPHPTEGELLKDVVRTVL